MIHPITRTLLNTIAAAIAGTAVLISIALWRLSTGPVSLAFLAPYMEQALSAENASYRVTFDELVLAWAGWERSVDIRAHHVKSFGPDGTLLFTVPEMAVELSIAAMLRGLIAPTKLELFGAELHLTHDVKRLLAIKTNEYSQDSSNFNILDVIRSALDNPHLEHPFSYLRSIHIKDGDFLVYDSKLNPRWGGKNVDVIIAQSKKRLVAELDLVMELDEYPINVGVTAVLAKKTGLIKADFKFSPLKLKQLSRITSTLEALEGLDLPLSGQATVFTDLQLEVHETTFELKGGPGRVSLNGLFPEPPSLDVSNLQVQGVFKPSLKTLILEEVLIETDGTKINANSLIKGEWASPIIIADITLENLPVSRISTIWPQHLAENARRWITGRISGGNIERLDAHLNLEPNAWEHGITDRETLYAQFVVKGSTVDYLPGLPIAETVTATGWYDGIDLHININEGRIENQNLRNAIINISDINGPEEHGIIQIESFGPLDHLLQTFDPPALRDDKMLQMAPGMFSGSVESNLEIRFPLLSDLTVNNLEISGIAKLEDVVARGLTPSPLLPKIDLKNLRGEVIIDKNGINLTGTADTINTNIKFSWHENFNPAKTDDMRRINLHARLGEEERAFLKVDDQRVLGVTDANIILSTSSDGITKGNFFLDVTETQLDLPVLRWNKISGAPGQAAISLVLENGIPVENPTFIFNSGQFRARGHAELNNKTSLDTLVFELLEVGDTRLSGRLNFKKNGGQEIYVSAEYLDMRPYRNTPNGDQDKHLLISGTAEKIILTDEISLYEATGHLTQQKDGGITIEGQARELDLRAYFTHEDDNAELSENNGPRPASRNISGTIETVLIDDQVQFSNLRGSAHYDGEKIDSADIEIFTENSEKIQLRITENENDRFLSIDSENAGGVLRALDITDDVVGGTLNLKGTFLDEEQDTPLTGNLTISEFYVVNAPPLAKLLTIATLTGALELLSGQGLPFDQMHAPFRYQTKKLSLNKARATGLSLGLTINGEINFDNDTIDLTGTIIPAYVLNSIVGHLPIIGDILTGGDGDGVFAATYRAKGPLKDTKITVNPLTALAPGILRDLFKLFEPAQESPDEFN